jgi:hypothetical protein
MHKPTAWSERLLMRSRRAERTPTSVITGSTIASDQLAMQS